MKSAQGKYTFAGIDLLLYLYFDPKVFDLIVPALTTTEQDNFIRQICDSIAIVMPKENIVEKQFYIKRAYQHPDSQTIMLFCTDGFLVDAKLRLLTHTQPFQNERIKITKIAHLPARFKLTSEIMKTIQDTLAEFEEDGRKIFSTIRTVIKELPRIEKETSFREFEPDRTADTFSEINHLKKEISEIVKSRAEYLKELMNQMDATGAHIHRLILQEANAPLQQANKKKLEEYADKTISHYCSDFTKEKEFLRKKIEEINPIQARFEKETSEADKRIAKALESLTAFKEHIVQALYDCAYECSHACLKQLPDITPNARKLLLNDFNRKFVGIAQLSETGELTTLADAKTTLVPLTLENLQEIISSDNKENPGLLQKCNTSWTVESPELQLLLKKLSQLNILLRNFFSANDQYAEYAEKEMIQIVRIPFPRSFQFKFTEHAFHYKQAIDDFGKNQRELISEAAKSYKKIMQIDNAVDKIKRAMIDAEKAADAIKISVRQYQDLLQQQENCDALVHAIATQYKPIEKRRHAIDELQQIILSTIKPQFKLVRKKIEMLIREMRIEIDLAQKTMLAINNIKEQIDALIEHLDNGPPPKEIVRDIDDKIKIISEKSQTLSEQTKKIDNLADKLSLYEQIVYLTNQTANLNNNTMIALQNQAKTLVAKYLKQQNPTYGTLSDAQKKEVIDFYMQIDSHAVVLEKENQHIIEMQNKLLAELNDRKMLLSDQDIQKRVQSIQEKMRAFQAAKTQITESLEAIKNKL